MLDSSIAVSEGTSARPSTLMNNRADKLEELGEFHDTAVAKLKHLLISVSSLNGGWGGPHAEGRLCGTGNHDAGTGHE